MSNEKNPTPAAPAGPPPEFWANLIEELKAGRDPKNQAEALAKLRSPDNLVTPGKNYQNPRGREFPLPRLKCEFFAPHTIHPEYHGLDREEIELFNLLEPGHYRYTKTDGSEEPLVVTGQNNEQTGKLERLRLKCEQFSKDMKGQRFPGMRQVLREILAQHPGDIPEKAKAVLSMKDERALIAKGELPVTV